MTLRHGSHRHRIEVSQAIPCVARRRLPGVCRLLDVDEVSDGQHGDQIQEDDDDLRRKCRGASAGPFTIAARFQEVYVAE